MHNTIKLTISKNGIGEITLQRPQAHNALNAEMIAELTETLKDLQENEQVRVLSLQGEGKSFCAGADLVWMQQTVEYEAKENFNDAVKLADLLAALYYFPKPTLAVVHGSAYGGGVGLVACCDMAICDESARFCLSETKLGLVPATISPYVLEAIGMRALRYLTYTAMPVTAKQVLRLGLVHEVLNADELINRKNVICEHISLNGPQALLTAKQLFKRLQVDHDEFLSLELAELIASVRVGQEAQERMLEFLRCSKRS